MEERDQQSEETHFLDDQEDVESISLVPLAMFHLIMIIVALFWSGTFVIEAFQWSATSVLYGFGFGVLLVVSGVLLERYPPMGKLKSEIARLFHGWHSSQMLLMVVTGVVAEEIFFRGALLHYLENFASETLVPGLIQDGFGVVISSVIFGVVHGGLWGKYVLWSVWAMGAGLVFGGLMLFTQSLWGPIVAHGMVNAYFFWSLKRAVSS